MTQYCHKLQRKIQSLIDRMVTAETSHNKRDVKGNKDIPDYVRIEEAKNLIKCEEITCHIIFDIKMYFAQKAKSIINGATTDASAPLTYSSVLASDSIKLAFLVPAQDDLDVVTCDKENKDLNGPC